MIRRPNLKFLVAVAVPLLAASAGVYALHGAQIKRSAGLLLQQADLAEQEGDLDEALSYLNRYIGLRPDDAEAAAKAGLIRADQVDDGREALQAFLVLERALRLDPSRDDVRRKAVELAMRPDLARFNDAVVHLKVLLDKEPEDPELRFLMASALDGDRKDDEAEEAYQEALKVDPQRIETYVRLADLYRDRFDNEAAADRVMGITSTIEGLVANNPDDASAYLERGLYRARHEQEGVAEDFDRALELAPNDPEVLLASAGVALDRENPDEAKVLLERARTQAPEDVRVAQGLARLAMLDNDSEAAIASLQQGLDTISEDDTEARVQLLFSLAETLVDAGRFDEAREHFSDLRRNNIRPGLLDFLEGKAHIAEGNWREGISSLANARTSLIDQDELTYQIDLLLGNAYERIGNPDQRLASYRRAVATNPVAIPGLLGLASSQAALGRYQEAIAAYRPLVDQVPGIRTEIARLSLAEVLARPESARNWAAVDRTLTEAEADQPDSTELPLLRAQALLARNQTTAARDRLAQAVKQHPEDPALRSALASLIGRDGDRDAALEELDDLEAREGDTATTRIARISYWVAQGGDEARAALSELEQGIDSFEPDDQRRIINALIIARRQLGDLTEAERLLGDLGKLVPGEVALQLVGMELTLAEDTDEARKEVAAEIDTLLTKLPPEDLPILARLFDLALAADAEPQAAKVLKLLRPAEGEEGPIWRQAESRLLILQAQRLNQGPERRALLSQARGLLNEAASRRPGWAPVPLTLSFVEDLDGNAPAAIRALEQARELGVRDRTSLLRLYRLYLGEGRTEQADALAAELQTLGLGDEDGLIARLNAESSLRQADPARALEQARAIVPADSEDYRDHLWLAQFLLAADQIDEAEAELRKALALAKGEPAPLISLVRLLAANDRRDEALEAIESAKNDLPADQAALTLARCYAALGDTDQAFAQFDRAIASAPKDPAPLRAAAETALITNQLPKSEDYLGKLARFGAEAPDDATWARRTLALIMAASGDPTKRREALDQLGTDQPAAGDAIVDELRTRAQVLTLQVDPESRRQAIRLLEQIIDQRAAGTPDDRYLLAQLFEADGQWSRAQQTMVSLLAEFGDNPTYVTRYVGWLLVPEPGRGHEPNPEAARPWIERLARLAPDTIQTAEAQARYLVATDKLDEAIAGLQRFADRQPDQLEAVALLVDRLDSPARAEPLYRRLVEQGDTPAPLLRLASALERQEGDRLAEAEQLYRQFATESSEPTAVFPLAGFFARQGRLDDALALCEQAVASCPPNAVANAVVALIFGRAANSDQLDRAATLVDQLRIKNPNEVEILFQLANLRSLQGRNDEVERLFRDSVRRAPGQPGPLNNLAWFLAISNRSKAPEALDLINQAIANVGPDPNLLDTRALVLLQLDRVDDAVNDLTLAISRSRQPDAIWYVHLAQAHLAANRRTEAAEALASARALGLDESTIPPVERSAFEQLTRTLGVSNGS
ncbi:tetratricopeptide repeat protein [Tautonia rosea]|uniref:tetratricopeptide repeat protein n=1 Tax=Tautonia rosea TaxID=2728037 RepID=UPI001472F540|nr:tetratricopeptide repeat protein [Tautonia rosea]